METPLNLLVVLVRAAFRAADSYREGAQNHLMAADYVVKRIPQGVVNLEGRCLSLVYRDEEERRKFGKVFDLNKPEIWMLPAADPLQYEAALRIGLAKLGLSSSAEQPAKEFAELANRMNRSEAVAVHAILSAEADKRRWTNFGKLLVTTGLDVVAAQPNLIGIKGKAETLVGAFASRVSDLLGQDADLKPGEGPPFVQLAAQSLLQASIEIVAENPASVVKNAQWADFVGHVLEPFKNAKTNDPAQFLTLDRMGDMMRGPVAQAALSALQEKQGAILGKRFAADTALGAITQEVLSLCVSAEHFDVREVFSSKSLAAVYTSALAVVEKRPELFIGSRAGGNGQPRAALTKLVKDVAGVMRESGAPFTADPGLGDRLTAVVMDAVVDHLAIRTDKDFGDEGPWGIATGQVLKSILLGFKSGSSTTPVSVELALSRVFSRDQLVSVVKIFATQAAKNPAMLLGDKTPGDEHKNELFRIAQAVATFMADPNTSLASPSNWEAVIGIALEEAAKNPGALFNLDPKANPQSHLAVELVTLLLQSASASARADSPDGADPLRRLGSVLFGDTLQQAIAITLRAAANNARELLADVKAKADNARALLDSNTHLGALENFISQLQDYTFKQGGRVGAADWLWLYKFFISEVIEQGPNFKVTEDMLEKALKAPADKTSETQPEG